ncbi:MAG: flagellar protein FlgN [Desulfovibrionaceae bacterium]
MFQRIHDTLHRQQQALGVLGDLLEEEYQLLIHHDTQAVVALEFSIHELIRQLAQEKASIVQMLGGGKVLHYAEMLPEEEAQQLRTLFQNIDRGEQRSSRQASVNTELSLALLDQSQATLTELHNQVAPKSSLTYGRRGAMDDTRRPQASMISGRL